MKLSQKIQLWAYEAKNAMVGALDAVPRGVVRTIDPTFDKKADQAVLAGSSLEVQGDKMVAQGHTLIKNGSVKQAEGKRKQSAAKAWRGR